MGNIDAKRDWGFAGDFVDAMWRMLQQETPEDYVIATGEMHSVREFIELSFEHVGTRIDWKGKGVDETGINAATGKTLVRIDPQYYRPAEVEQLLGNPAKARAKLGWEPKVKFKELVGMMVESDLKGIVNP
jgi:GDPmannose 4,6-dehydratase